MSIHIPAAPRINYTRKFTHPGPGAYTGQLINTGNTDIYLPTRPQEFAPSIFVDRLTNRVETGATQTLFRNVRTVHKLRFDFLNSERPTNDASYLQQLLDLWYSTLARETFLLWIHKDYSSNYPSPVGFVVRQPLLVQWAEGFDMLAFKRMADTPNLWTLNLEFEEAIS